MTIPPVTDVHFFLQLSLSGDPLAEQLDENIGYRRHKLEMNSQSSNLRGCVAAKLRPSRDP